MDLYLSKNYILNHYGISRYRFDRILMANEDGAIDPALRTAIVLRGKVPSIVVSAQDWERASSSIRKNKRIDKYEGELPAYMHDTKRIYHQGQVLARDYGLTYLQFLDIISYTSSTLPMVTMIKVMNDNEKEYIAYDAHDFDEVSGLIISTQKLQEKLGISRQRINEVLKGYTFLRVAGKNFYFYDEIASRFRIER